MIRTDVRELIMEELKSLGCTKSIDTISVTEICCRCGISRQTFYQYFRDKYDLISQIFSKAITDVLKDLTEPIPLDQAIGGMLTNVKKDSTFYINAVRYTGQNSLIEMMLFHVYDTYIKDLTYRMGKDPEESMLFEIRYAAYGGAGSMLDWIRNGMKEEPFVMAKMITDCLSPRMEYYYYRCPFFVDDDSNC